MDDQSPYSITVDKSADGYVARLLDGKTEVRAVTRETPDLALTCVMSAIRQQLPAVPPRDAPRLHAFYNFLVVPDDGLDASCRIARLQDGTIVAKIDADDDSEILQVNPDCSVICWANETHFASVDAKGGGTQRLMHAVILADKTVEYSDDSLLSADMLREIRETDKDITAFEKLEELFWSTINEAIDDPLLAPDDPFLQDEEIRFLSGSQEALEEQVKLAIFTDPAAREMDQIAVRITAEGEFEVDDWFCPLDTSHLTKDTLRAVQKAIEANAFTGTRVEYNDGARNRRSGYSQYPEELHLELDRPSAHQLAAMRRRQRTGDTPDTGSKDGTDRTGASTPEA